MTLRNWAIGYYIIEYEQAGSDRAEYGTNLLKKLENEISQKGMNSTLFKYCRNFYLLYPQIGATVSDQLGLQDFEKSATVSHQFMTKPEILISNLPYVSENFVFGLPKGDDLMLSAKIVYNKEYVNEHYPNKTEEELKEIIWKDIKEINKGLTNYKHIKDIIITDEPMIKTSTAKIKRYEEIKKEQ